MKSYSYLIILFLCTTATLRPTIGCMSKSTNLAIPDYKQYHYVSCSCPCGNGARYAILSQRGICRECRHYHELKPITVLTGKIMPLPIIQKLSTNPIARFFQEQDSLLF